jgi:hypothetical protein
VYVEYHNVITKFAQEPNGGLVVAPAPPTFDNIDLEYTEVVPGVCTENLIRIDWGRESSNVSAQ